MISGTFRVLSDEEIKERKAKQEKEIKILLYEEYENFKKYINFYELPEIREIEILSMRGCDAAVLPNLSNIAVRINKKFLGNKFPEYLKIILFHEFTHIWDAAVKYGDFIANNLTEYHAVQVAFAKNIGQSNINSWEKFSEAQCVWDYDKRVTAKKYIEDLFENYSYKMEYNYYNESEERTQQFMYDLCQWIGYSVIFEKYCLEWEGKQKATIYIPKDMEKEINQFYISLRDNHEKKQIIENYNAIQLKFGELNQIKIVGEENYFLGESNKDIGLVESFRKHCVRIEDVYADMKKKHGTKSFLTRPYLNRSFAFMYFGKMYQKMLKCVKWENLYKRYMEHFILCCPDNIEELNSVSEEIKPYFEKGRYFDVVIDKIKNLSSVEIDIDEKGNEVYLINDLERFIKEINYTPAFLAALLKGIADAGIMINLLEETMIINRI